jgi:integrase/recombinase XerC
MRIDPTFGVVLLRNAVYIYTSDNFLHGQPLVFRSMTESVTVFLDYLTHEKRLSRHTVEAYRSDLLQLSDHLGLLGIEAPNADRNDLRGWMVSLSEQALSPLSINRKIAAVKAYYKFLRKRGLVSKDPAALLVALKKPRKLPGFVEESAMELLFDELGFDSTPAGRRDQLVMEILYGTGMRLSELIGLKTVDFNRENRTLKVFGKRSKTRIIPITPGLAALIEAYLSDRAIFDGGEVLLLTDRGEKLYPVFVQRLVKRYLSAVSSIDHKSPHLLRHTYATHLLNRGADLNAIKELLGHTSLAATQVYTHNAIEELKRTFLQAHPKA